MRRPAAATLLAIPILIFDAWGVEAGPPSEDELAVREVVQSYFDGMVDGRSDKLLAAFDTDAVLIGRRHDGMITRIPVQAWSTGMGSGVEKRRAYRNQIAAIDIAGDAAMVKAVLTWPGVRYVDYLSLVRDGEGQWRIVNKVWDATVT